MKKINDYSLYLVTSQEFSLGRSTLKVAEEAIYAGIDILQMREKDMPDQQLRELGKELSTLSKKHNILFITNDDPYLAKEINSSGVHLGQEDLKKYPIFKVREILGKDKLIGLSTHSLIEVNAANKQDIDYIAYGPVFKTKTKNYSIGADNIEAVLKTSRFPVVFIGGININNIKMLLKRGAKNIAVIREITENPDIERKVKELKNIINEYNS